MPLRWKNSRRSLLPHSAQESMSSLRESWLSESSREPSEPFAKVSLRLPTQRTDSARIRDDRAGRGLLGGRFEPQRQAEHLPDGLGDLSDAHAYPCSHVHDPGDVPGCKGEER